MHAALQLQESLNCPFFLVATTCNDVIFPLKFTYPDCYHQSDIISEFKSFQMCLTRNITLQCGLSEGKLKLVVSVV